MDPLSYKLLWVFGWAALFFSFWYVRGSRRQRAFERLHTERMAAIQKGVPLPELPAYDDSGERSALAAVRAASVNPRWPLGVGAISFMAGMGLCLAFALSGDPEDRKVWSYGLVGVFFGLGFVLHYFVTRAPRA